MSSILEFLILSLVTTVLLCPPTGVLPVAMLDTLVTRVLSVAMRQRALQ